MIYLAQCPNVRHVNIMGWSNFSGKCFTFRSQITSASCGKSQCRAVCHPFLTTNAKKEKRKCNQLKFAKFTNHPRIWETLGWTIHSPWKPFRVNASWVAFVANGPAIRKPCLQANWDSLRRLESKRLSTDFHSYRYLQDTLYVIFYGAICDRHKNINIEYSYTIKCTIWYMYIYIYVQIMFLLVHNSFKHQTLVAETRWCKTVARLNVSCVLRSWRESLAPESNINCMTQPFDPTKTQNSSNKSTSPDLLLKTKNRGALYVWCFVCVMSPVRKSGGFFFQGWQPQFAKKKTPKRALLWCASSNPIFQPPNESC